MCTYRMDYKHHSQIDLILCTKYNSAASSLRFRCVGGCGIEPRTVSTVALTVRRIYHLARPHPCGSTRSHKHRQDLIHSAKSHPQSARSHSQRLDLIHTRLDLIHSQLDLIHSQLDMIHSQQSARSYPHLG